MRIIFLIICSLMSIIPMAEARRPTDTPPISDVMLLNFLSSLHNYQNILEHITIDPRNAQLGYSGYHVWATFGGREHVCVNVGHGVDPTMNWVCHGLAPFSKSTGWFPHPFQCASGSASSLVINFDSNVLDDSNDQTAYIFLTPKTGSITSVGFLTESVITTGDSTLTIRLETVDNATGFPTGTLCGTSTNGTQVITSAQSKTWFEVTLTNGCSVTYGDPLAVVIGGTGSSILGTIYIATSPILKGMSSALPYTIRNTNGVGWGKDGSIGPAVGVIKYSDGTYPSQSGLVPYSSVLSILFDSTSSPDEIGNVIIPTQNIGVIGAWVMAHYPNFDVILYDNDGISILEQVLIPRYVTGDTFLNVEDGYLVYFSIPHTLMANQTYRLIVRPRTTDVGLSKVWVNNANYFQATFGNSAGVVETERTDSGVWTQINTQRACLGFITSKPW